MLERPHVAPALLHTRGWVALCAMLVVLAAVGQMAIFGIVHFTSARLAPTEPTGPAHSTLVVRGAPAPASDGAPAPPRTSPRPASAASRDADERPVAPTDGVLRGISVFTATAGILGAIVLAWMSAIGAIVAAGGCVPGVDKVVRAAGCAFILAIAALPLGQVLGSEVFLGVFSTYSAMTNASELAQRGLVGETALLGQFVVLPLLAVAMAIAVALWFRSGVEAGVICTSVNDMDRKLEAEIASVRSRGATHARGTVRAMGALDHAIGASPIPSVAPPPPSLTPAPTLRAAEDDLDVERILGRRGRRMNEADPGNPLKRMI